jgi:hypothetical protein
MELLLQLLMGISLAACAGLRAWMPLLLLGILGRAGYVPLNDSFELLTHTGTLAALGVATVVEVLGDKVVAVDNLLDSLGTFLRPAAGTVLAGSLLTGMSPELSLILGLVTGGGAALAVHSGKSVVRAGVTATAPAHAGAGNAALSVAEDVLAFGGIWAAILVPVIAFVVLVVLAFFAFRMIGRTRARGADLLRSLRRGRPAS